MTAELDAWKANFKNTEFNFKKFDVSSAKVETMIETQLKWKNRYNQGLGYDKVPPPFNDNYTVTPAYPGSPVITISRTYLITVGLIHVFYNIEINIIYTCIV